MTDKEPSYPTVVCFPGSGSDPLPSWSEFVKLAREKYTVVLYDRGSESSSLENVNRNLLQHLKEQNLDPPYVLIAHSHGGAFAKLLLHRQPELVAGMVLAETGQEGGLSHEIEKSLLNRAALGDRPLSVIRCNSLIASWKALEIALATNATTNEKPGLIERKQFLQTCDREDERLKRAQLGLSRVTRYVHLPECGHNTIRERPDLVVEELQWVMANLQPEQISTNLWTRLTRSIGSWTQR